MKRTILLAASILLSGAILALGGSIGFYSGVFLRAPDREKLGQVPDCFFVGKDDPDWPEGLYKYAKYLVETEGIDPASLSFEGACIVIDAQLSSEGPWVKIWIGRERESWMIVREHCYLRCPDTSSPTFVPDTIDF